MVEDELRASGSREGTVQRKETPTIVVTVKCLGQKNITCRNEDYVLESV